MKVKEMASSFYRLSKAKEKSSLNVRVLTLFFTMVVVITMFFCYSIVKSVTDRILVVNTGGEYLQLQSMETDKLYKTLLEAHCARVGYLVNSFDKISMEENKEQASYLVQKSELEPIYDKYYKDRAYADVLDRGIVYKCKFLTITSMENNADEYKVKFQSVLTIYDGALSKKILIESIGTAIRVKPKYPLNVTGFYFKEYQQKYYNYEN